MAISYTILLSIQGGWASQDEEQGGVQTDGLGPAMRVYKEVGCDGWIVSDHVPGIREPQAMHKHSPLPSAIFGPLATGRHEGGKAGGETT